MSKHTPGPWKVGWVDDQKEFIIMGPLDCIATVHEPDLPNAVEHEAIAHLIGAAPDLLAALKVIAKFAVETELDGADGAKWTWREIAAKQAEIAKAAIATAEGEC